MCFAPKAVLAVIDPKRTHFTGGVCCWRADQSRTLKTLERCEGRGGGGRGGAAFSGDADPAGGEA